MLAAFLFAMRFKQWECEIQFAKYANGRTAIILIGTGQLQGELIAVATVNIPDEELQDSEVIIKDYSENESMYQCLLKEGIIKPSHRKIETGWVFCPVSHLNVQI